MIGGYRNTMMSTYHKRRKRRQANMRTRSKGKFEVRHRAKGGRTGSSRKK